METYTIEQIKKFLDEIEMGGGTLISTVKWNLTHLNLTNPERFRDEQYYGKVSKKELENRKLKITPYRINS